MLSKLDQHDEKVNHVVNLADQLIENEHYASDKIKDKIDSIKERWVAKWVISNFVDISIL